MKHLIVLLLFVCVCFTNTAQNIKIEGKLLDEKSNAEIAATISLISKDSVQIASTITNNYGNFELTALKDSAFCFLRITHLEFENSYSPLVLDRDTTITVHLNEKSILLNEVQIVAKKPIYEFQNEKLIVNIGEIPNIQTYNVSRLTQMLPGVVNSDGALTLNGQAATVYLDGRKQTLNASNINTIIESMPVASIEKIELIYSSNGVYDASDGAIINIVYKKQRVDGYYLSITGGSGIYDKSNLDGESSAIIMVKKKNVMFNSMLSYRNNYLTSQANDTLHYWNDAFLYQDRNRKGRLNVYMGMFNLNWNVKNGHSLNFNFNLYDDFSRNHSTQQSILQNNGIIQDVWNVKTKGNGDLWAGQVEYVSPDTLNNKFKASYGIVYGGMRNYRNTFEEGAEILYTDDEMIAHRHTVKLDYEHKFSEKMNLLLGLKTDLGQLNDDVIYTETTNFNRYPTSNFFGKENIYAAYVQLRYRFDPKWSANASLRSEHTYYSLDFTTQDENLTNSYTNLFPFFTTSYNSSNRNYQSSLSFGSSIERPDYEYMLPGLRYSNQYSYTQGNPELKPRTDYTVTWRSLFYQFINAYLGYNFGTNVIGLTAKNSAIDPLIVEREYQNIADLSAILAGVNVYYKLLSDKLSGQISGSVQQVNYKNPKNGFDLSQRKNDYWRGTLYANCNYQITSQLGINCQYFFYPKYEDLIYIRRARWRMNAGIYYNSKKDKWSLSLDGYDIFHTDKSFREMYFDGNYNRLHSYSNSQFVRLSFIMKFKGGEKVEDKAKTGSLEMDRFSTNQ
jgi:hypothetical protein